MNAVCAPAQVRTLLVLSDDWGRHPSSCQHLVRRLTSRYRVHWMNTVGTRPPRLDFYTLQRGLQKLCEWAKPTEPKSRLAASNPTVLRPLMWPSFRSAAARRFNAGRMLTAIKSSISPDEGPVCITTLPIAADLVGRVSGAKWIYYCVDDLAEWPGLDREPLQRMESSLVERVDAVVAASERLADRMAAMGRSATLVTHGVDLEMWAETDVSAPADFAHLPKPWVVFWGLLDQRLDVKWVEALSRRMLRGSILLVGPENNPDLRLKSMANVVLPGPMAFERLPSLAAHSDVLVMPYVDSPATGAMQPLKFKEYLATGHPVVARRLPATVEWNDAADLVDDAESFATRVAERLAGGTPRPQLAARSRLQSESWEAKSEQFERVWLSGDAS